MPIAQTTGGPQPKPKKPKPVPQPTPVYKAAANEANEQNVNLGPSASNAISPEAQKAAQKAANKTENFVEKHPNLDPYGSVNFDTGMYTTAGGKSTPISQMGKGGGGEGSQPGPWESGTKVGKWQSGGVTKTSGGGGAAGGGNTRYGGHMGSPDIVGSRNVIQYSDGRVDFSTTDNTVEAVGTGGGAGGGTGNPLAGVASALKNTSIKTSEQLTGMSVEEAVRGARRTRKTGGQQRSQ